MLRLAELENHLGIADKTLAEFIIDLSKGKESARDFKKQLDSNGADMPQSLVETLFNLIKRLMVTAYPLARCRSPSVDMSPFAIRHHHTLPPFPSPNLQAVAAVSHLDTCRLVQTRPSLHWLWRIPGTA